MPGDIAAVTALIERSARALASDHYPQAHIEAALSSGAWALDRQLIDDGTLFVAEIDGRVAGCGAWSFRRALFGSAELPERDSRRVDPASEPAKIRMFFVDPSYARRGIGRRILERCEAEAERDRFREAELAATLPGRPFYASCGYAVTSTYDFECAPGIFLPITVMRKRLSLP